MKEVCGTEDMAMELRTWSDPVGARQPIGRRASRVQPLSVQQRRPHDCAFVISGGAATFP